MVVDEDLFKSEWFVEMPVDDRYMYLYLLSIADRKVGSFEWNERMVNFCANCSKRYTKGDILKLYDGRIQEVPGRSNTLIFVNFVRFNWMKGKESVTSKSPLFKAIFAKLRSLDLTLEQLNEMSRHGLKCPCPAEETPPELALEGEERDDGGTTEADIAKMFDAFWSAYPSECPRKTDKKKCRAKFGSLMDKSDDPVSLFNAMMNGLQVWKECDTWTRDGGQFIRAPLVWLNNENWNDKPTKGNGNASGRKSGAASANANYQSADSAGIF